eukprot:scaffold222055_cov32-Tisochrysis_lutea.AAC.2
MSTEKPVLCGIDEARQAASDGSFMIASPSSARAAWRWVSLSSFPSASNGRGWQSLNEDGSSKSYIKGARVFARSTTSSSANERPPNAQGWRNTRAIVKTSSTGTPGWTAVESIVPLPSRLPVLCRCLIAPSCSVGLQEWGSWPHWDGMGSCRPAASACMLKSRRMLAATADGSVGFVHNSISRSRRCHARKAALRLLSGPAPSPSGASRCISDAEICRRGCSNAGRKAPSRTPRALRVPPIEAGAVSSLVVMLPSNSADQDLATISAAACSHGGRFAWCTAYAWFRPEDSTSSSLKAPDSRIWSRSSMPTTRRNSTLRKGSRLSQSSCKAAAVGVRTPSSTPAAARMFSPLGRIS